MAKSLQQTEVDPSKGFETEEARRAAAQHQAVRERQKQSLNLQRENILSQRTFESGAAGGAGGGAGACRGAD